MYINLSAFLNKHKIPTELVRSFVAIGDFPRKMYKVISGDDTISLASANEVYEGDGVKTAIEKLYASHEPAKIVEWDRMLLSERTKRGVDKSMQILITLLYETEDILSEDGRSRVRIYTNRETRESLEPLFYSTRNGIEYWWSVKNPSKKHLSLIGKELPKVSEKGYKIEVMADRENIQVLPDRVMIPENGYYGSGATWVDIQGDIITITMVSPLRDHVLRETSEIRITKGMQLKRKILSKEKLYWMPKCKEGGAIARMQVNPTMCEEAREFFGRFEQLRPKYSGSRVFVAANDDIFIDIAGQGNYVPINISYQVSSSGHDGKVQFSIDGFDYLTQEIKNELEISRL